MKKRKKKEKEKEKKSQLAYIQPTTPSGNHRNVIKVKPSNKTPICSPPSALFRPPVS